MESFPFEKNTKKGDTDFLLIQTMRVELLMWEKRISSTKTDGKHQIKDDVFR